MTVDASAMPPKAMTRGLCLHCWNISTVPHRKFGSLRDHAPSFILGRKKEKAEYLSDVFSWMPHLRETPAIEEKNIRSSSMPKKAQPSGPGLSCRKTVSRQLALTHLQMIVSLTLTILMTTTETFNGVGAWPLVAPA